MMQTTCFQQGIPPAPPLLWDDHEDLNSDNADTASDDAYVGGYNCNQNEEFELSTNALRRERNRLSARRCRAKRRAFLAETQRDLALLRHEIGVLRRTIKNLQISNHIVNEEAGRLRAELADALVALGRAKCTPCTESACTDTRKGPAVAGLLAVAAVEAHFL